jgi:hypothetical protein
MRDSRFVDVSFRTHSSLFTVARHRSLRTPAAPVESAATERRTATRASELTRLPTLWVSLVDRAPSTAPRSRACGGAA